MPHPAQADKAKAAGLADLPLRLIWIDKQRWE
jgi:hypothetical protein